MPPRSRPPRRRSPLGWLAGLLLGLYAAGAPASEAALAGILGRKALLVVGGHPPRPVGVGEVHAGVRVLEVHRNLAVVEQGGQRVTLYLGEAPVSVGPSGGPQRLVLRADARGHFFVRGTVNGQPQAFMVDTGASTLAIGRSDADRLGIPYQRQGIPVRISTANGTAQAWRVQLAEVQLGSLQFQNIEAVVTPENMPYALLGNSLLGQVRMQRDRHEMVLER